MTVWPFTWLRRRRARRGAFAGVVAREATTRALAVTRAVQS